MGAPGQQAQPFVAALRSRRYRAASAVLIAFILLAQALLVVHRIDHSRPEHGAACALCVAADHSPAPTHEAAVALSPSAPDTVSACTRTLTTALLVLCYHSRAPPPDRYQA
jgi:predicted metal-binding membrane protein